MLECKDVADGASDYIDGRMPLTPRLAVWLHLSMCALCRAYVRQLRRTVDVLQRVGGEDEPTPDAVRDAALAALTKTPAGIAGVADRVGSLSPGMDADFLVLSGRPTELSSRILEVFVNGERVYRRPPDPEPKREEAR